MCRYGGHLGTRWTEEADYCVHSDGFSELACVYQKIDICKKKKRSRWSKWVDQKLSVGNAEIHTMIW